MLRCGRGNVPPHMSNLLASLIQISSRQMAAAIALACAGLLAYGYYLQYFEAQDPCPLCLVQRGFFYAIGFVMLAAALHGPKGAWARRGYALGGALFAAGGLATAARQVWLQHLPADQVPACGPDLAFMVENFPLARTFELLLRGSGQCAEVGWTFLGLSIAEWSLAWFAIFLALSAWMLARARR
jgi:protein dithiol:quinone oxidoreductase